MERWREPWESEEEKEIFVSNVMQQVRAIVIVILVFDVSIFLRLRERKEFSAETNLPAGSLS